MDSNERLKKELDIIRVKIEKIIRNITTDNANDFDVCYFIMYSNYNDEVYKVFWDYFREKYELPEIKQYFDNYNVLFKTIFYYCIKPYQLKLDAVNVKNKHKFKAIFHSVVSNIIRFFLNNWIIISSFILMVIILLFAFFLEDKETVLYELSINVGMSFLIAIIISFINESHRRKIRNRKKKINLAIYEFKILRDTLEKVKNMMNNKIENKYEFAMEFFALNNILKKFLIQTINNEIFRSMEDYYNLIDYEKEIYRYSINLVAKPFKKHKLDSITKNELGKLQIYIIQLNELLCRLEFNLRIMKNRYAEDINKMEDKSL